MRMPELQNHAVQKWGKSDEIVLDGNANQC